MPVEPAERVHEMRAGRAERERADGDPKRCSAARPEPGRDQLQRRRIDAREKEASRQAEGDRKCRAVCEDEEHIHRRRSQAARQDEPLHVQHVGEVEGTRRERTGNEANLDGDREPRGRRVRKVPFAPKLRHDRRGGEPGRHQEDERNDEHAERPPAPGHIGSVHTSAVPSSTTVPSWLATVVRSLVSGLSSRTSSTSTSAVISSPG